MMILRIVSILGQINLEGFEEAAQQNTLFAVLVSMVLVLFGISTYLFKKIEDKNQEIKLLQEKFSTKIEDIRKEEMAKEDIRSNQWRESEKETLIVLRGVNSVLEMSEKMKENDTEKIIEKISTLNSSIKEMKTKNGK